MPAGWILLGRWSSQMAKVWARHVEGSESIQCAKPILVPPTIMMLENDKINHSLYLWYTTFPKSFKVVVHLKSSLSVFSLHVEMYVETTHYLHLQYTLSHHLSMFIFNFTFVNCLHVVLFVLEFFM